MKPKSTSTDTIPLSAAGELNKLFNTLERQHRQSQNQSARLFPGDSDRARRLGEAHRILEAALKHVIAAQGLTPNEAAEVLDKLRREYPLVTGMTLEDEPPIASAPELWAKRDLNLRENAPAFIRRVYKDWLGKGLQRRHFKQLDDELYKALSVWLARHPDDPIAALLPPQSDAMDDIINQLSAIYPKEMLRRLGHAIDTRERKAARKKLTA